MGDKLPEQAGRARRPGASGQAEDAGFADALGHAVKVERTARGIGRKDLAARAGLSYPYLSEIENGSKRASSKALIAIARALDLAPSDLLRLAEGWAGSAPRVAEEPAGMYQRARVVASPVMGPPERRSWFHGASQTRDTRSQQLNDLMTLLEQLSDDDLARVRDLVERFTD